MAIRLFSVLLLASLAGSQTPGAPAAGDWPGWRGANRDAVSKETGLLRQWPAAGPSLSWKAAGLGAGFSSLAVAGDRIYTMGDRGGSQFVMARNRAAGQELWAANIGPSWDDEYGGPRSTPTVDGDRVYALGTEGDLVCLDAATGRVRWRKSAGRDFGGQMMSQWKYSESPLIDGDKLIFTPGSFGSTLVALDKLTGKTIWQAGASRLGQLGSNGAAYSSPVISEGAGVRQYIQLTGRGLVGIRASDGKLLWSYNRIANDVANIPTPAVRGDFVFASTGYGTGSALLKLSKTPDGVAASEVYFLEGGTFQNHHGGFVLLGDLLYAGHGHNQGFPICLELASGKVLWGGNFRNEGQGSAAVAYADGHLYFRYQNGRVLLIEATPAAYREKGSFQIPGVKNPSWSHPVIHGGKLYLREQDTLYAFDLRAAR